MPIGKLDKRFGHAQLPFSVQERWGCVHFTYRLRVPDPRIHLKYLTSKDACLESLHLIVASYLKRALRTVQVRFCVSGLLSKIDNRCWAIAPFLTAKLSSWWLMLLDVGAMILNCPFLFASFRVSQNLDLRYPTFDTVVARRQNVVVIGQVDAQGELYRKAEAAHPPRS